MKKVKQGVQVHQDCLDHLALKEQLEKQVLLVHQDHEVQVGELALQDLRVLLDQEDLELVQKAHVALEVIVELLVQQEFQDHQEIQVRGELLDLLAQLESPELLALLVQMDNQDREVHLALEVN